MNILIIGSKGFIGSYLVQSLTEKTSYTVYECDVVADYTNKNYFIADVSNTDYSAIFQLVDVHVCVNCSGAASVPDSIKNPHRDFMLNASNVFFMLDAIRKYRPTCKFINLSSAAVYGNPLELPIHEDTICKPVSPYGYNKLIAEQLCTMFHQQFGLNTCSTRIFSAYGNGLTKQIFWDIFQKSKTNATELRLFGTGNETRDFIHVEDIVKAILLIIEEGSFEATVYNVANGVEISIKEAASKLLAALGYSGSLIFGGEHRNGDPLYWCSNITKIKEIGYITSVGFDDGIKYLAKWLKEKN